MRLKDDSVELFGLRNEVLFALYVADEVYKELGVKEGIVVTSGVDGKHSVTSFHYAGNAVDIRTYTLPTTTSPATAGKMIKERLNIDFDVVVEKDHIHIEYQPRYRA